MRVRKVGMDTDTVHHHSRYVAATTRANGYVSRVFAQEGGDNF